MVHPPGVSQNPIDIINMNTSKHYSGRVPMIQSKNHSTNKGKTAGRHQYDTQSTIFGEIGINAVQVQKSTIYYLLILIS